MEVIQDPGAGSGVTPAKSIPYFAEMIDAYLTLHYDYMKTDSVTEMEELKLRLDNVENAMRECGCNILNCSEKWQKHLCALPDLVPYQLIVPDILRLATTNLSSTDGIVILQCLRTLEDVVLNKSGRRKCETQFYASTDIMEIVDGCTVRKNVMFSDLSMLRDAAVKSSRI